jgi:hypothetical protein
VIPRGVCAPVCGLVLSMCVCNGRLNDAGSWEGAGQRRFTLACCGSVGRGVTGGEGRAGVLLEWSEPQCVVWC